MAFAPFVPADGGRQAGSAPGVVAHGVCSFSVGRAGVGGGDGQPQVSLRTAVSFLVAVDVRAGGGFSPRCRCASGKILPYLGKTVLIAAYRLKLSKDCHDAAALRAVGGCDSGSPCGRHGE
jgi:hypothetical protein